MILLLSDDLLDASKTMASARAAGITIRQCKSVASAVLEMEMTPFACCIVDLHLPDLDLSLLQKAATHQNPSARIVAYGSHVDTERLKAARQLGCDEVMPRSVYFEEMPRRIVEWANR